MCSASALLDANLMWHMLQVVAYPSIPRTCSMCCMSPLDPMEVEGHDMHVYLGVSAIWATRRG
eukprot:2364569-Pyramimonas_sp.AAC.1